MTRDWFSRGDKGNRRRVIWRRRKRAALGGKRFAFHAVDQRSAIQRRHRDPKRGLRKSIDRELRFASKTVLRKSRRESFERFWIDRLRAVQRRAPGAQVHTFDILVGDLSDAQLVGKVWRGSNRAAVLMEGLQPALRPGEKRERRHHCEWHAVMQQGEPRANQAHVVIKRQPANANVARPQLQGLADRAHVG